MNWRVARLVIIIVSVVSFAAIGFRQNRSDNVPLIKNPMLNVQTMKITSQAFDDGGAIPSKYTCDGENINPPLEIASVPEGTKSIAFIMEDPDAPLGIWVHWVKWNIPPETKIIEKGKEPPGVSGKGTSGNLSYEGPCPPNDVHHYIFRVYALDTELALQSGASKKDLESAMEGHILGKGELVGLYSRQ